VVVFGRVAITASYARAPAIYRIRCGHTEVVSSNDITIVTLQ
jgi:hypothetical protein